MNPCKSLRNMNMIKECINVLGTPNFKELLVSKKMENILTNVENKYGDWIVTNNNNFNGFNDEELNKQVDENSNYNDLLDEKLKNFLINIGNRYSDWSIDLKPNNNVLIHEFMVANAYIKIETVHDEISKKLYEINIKNPNQTFLDDVTNFINYKSTNNIRYCYYDKLLCDKYNVVLGNSKKLVGLILDNADTSNFDLSNVTNHYNVVTKDMVDEVKKYRRVFSFSLFRPNNGIKKGEIEFKQKDEYILKHIYSPDKIGEPYAIFNSSAAKTIEVVENIVEFDEQFKIEIILDNTPTPVSKRDEDQPNVPPKKQQNVPPKDKQKDNDYHFLKNKQPVSNGFRPKNRYLSIEYDTTKSFKYRLKYQIDFADNPMLLSGSGNNQLTESEKIDILNNFRYEYYHVYFENRNLKNLDDNRVKKIVYSYLLSNYLIDFIKNDLYSDKNDVFFPETEFYEHKYLCALIFNYNYVSEEKNNSTIALINEEEYNSTFRLFTRERKKRKRNELFFNFFLIFCYNNISLNGEGNIVLDSQFLYDTVYYENFFCKSGTTCNDKFFLLKYDTSQSNNNYSHYFNFSNATKVVKPMNKIIYDIKNPYVLLAYSFLVKIVMYTNNLQDILLATLNANQPVETTTDTPQPAKATTDATKSTKSNTSQPTNTKSNAPQQKETKKDTESNIPQPSKTKKNKENTTKSNVSQTTEPKVTVTTQSTTNTPQPPSGNKRKKTNETETNVPSQPPELVVTGKTQPISIPNTTSKTQPQPGNKKKKTETIPSQPSETTNNNAKQTTIPTSDKQTENSSKIPTEPKITSSDNMNTTTQQQQPGPGVTTRSKKNATQTSNQPLPTSTKNGKKKGGSIYNIPTHILSDLLDLELQIRINSMKKNKGGMLMYYNKDYIDAGNNNEHKFINKNLTDEINNILLSPSYTTENENNFLLNTSNHLNDLFYPMNSDQIKDIICFDVLWEIDMDNFKSKTCDGVTNLIGNVKINDSKKNDIEVLLHLKEGELKQKIQQLTSEIDLLKDTFNEQQLKNSTLDQQNVELENKYQNTKIEYETKVEELNKINLETEAKIKELNEEFENQKKQTKITIDSLTNEFEEKKKDINNKIIELNNNFEEKKTEINNKRKELDIELDKQTKKIDLDTANISHSLKILDELNTKLIEEKKEELRKKYEEMQEEYNKKIAELEEQEINEKIRLDSELNQEIERKKRERLDELQKELQEQSAINTSNIETMLSGLALERTKLDALNKEIEEKTNEVEMLKNELRKLNEQNKLADKLTLRNYLLYNKDFVRISNNMKKYLVNVSNNLDIPINILKNRSINLKQIIDNTKKTIKNKGGTRKNKRLFLNSVYSFYSEYLSSYIQTQSAIYYYVSI